MRQHGGSEIRSECRHHEEDRKCRVERASWYHRGSPRVSEEITLHVPHALPGQPLLCPHITISREEGENLHSRHSGATVVGFLRGDTLHQVKPWVCVCVGDELFTERTSDESQPIDKISETAQMMDNTFNSISLYLHFDFHTASPFHFKFYWFFQLSSQTP